ncbi:tyrosine-protein phosphatase, partial [Salmonella sp. s51228]|uniref:tyrosine-protein phosphatase n=1 Tax=Salmonella sp. s51228 TaxID=3159652 RepID=UPI0039806857
DYRVRVIKQSNDSSDYINASYVDGYKQKKAYIAAQSPIKESIPEFWRMVYEKESVVIVMLCQLNEYGQDMCEKYWPEKNESISFPFYTVECKEQVVKEGYIWRKLNIVFSIENKILWETVTREKKVNQMQILHWPGAEDDLSPMLQMI